ncbi:MAG: hypothetical protein K2I08_00945 [Muribaculaceae bacterium]|nr:hypothetical protein [Muribaculaceae bacterium]
MKEIIDRIYKRTTEYSHPSQATTIANSLELLSSGIYTEEERFVFELLQNAVDSYDGNSNGLDVRIVVGNGQLIFMHSGKAFSERDLEGLCDIGNGNKMSDAKKIGYKGIGFKSVFMHSKRVTVVTGNTCFRFDEEACKLLASQRGSGYQDVKMPWQIIPILSDIPEELDYDAYNVVTILEISNTEKLLKKVEKLLSDAKFLLFLKVANLRVTLFNDNNIILSLSKTQEGNILTLAKNEVAQSHWLMFAEDEPIPKEVKEDLIYDAKTPTKLKESDSVEISFAIALDDNGKIEPLKDAVVYTYLPTSFSFGFEFIVNANFITDAGRQQLIKDCEWNKFIFSQIPVLFLNWIKNEVAPNHEDWHKVLLPFTSAKDEMAEYYANSLERALASIPFVRTIGGSQIYIREAVMDKIQLSRGLPDNIFNQWISSQFSANVSYATLVDSNVGASLTTYGINIIDFNKLITLLQKETNLISTLSVEDWACFLQWLSQLENNQFGEYSIIPDENNTAMPALKLFFPSEYKDTNNMAEDAHIVNKELYALLNEDTKKWLSDIGVKEMDTFSIIENVLCEPAYITKNNSIKVLRFIFDANKKDAILDKLPSSKKNNLKVLTSANTLEKIDNTFLDKTYGTSIKLSMEDNVGIFISKEYKRSTDNPIDWQLFFRKLGANTDFEISKRSFGKDSQIFKELYSYVDYCSSHEKNYGYSIHTSGYFVHRYISAQLPPLIDLWTKYDWSRLIWGTVLTKPITLKRNDDFIAGHTGFNYYAYGYLTDNKDGHRYLGKYLIQYLSEKKKILPGTDGLLHTAAELIAPTETNINLVGRYLPMLYAQDTIDSSWFSYLNLKQELILDDYLHILARIEEDSSKDQIRENLERICRIYDRIADGGYDFREGSSDYMTLRNWGKTHKILSSERKFEFPCNLCLISSRLSGVELDNTVYHRRSQENDRFESFMTALGVNMITEHRVEGLEDAVSQNSVKESLLNKKEFFTALTLNGEISKKKWDEAVEKMHASISAIRFYSVPSIQVIYGKQSVEKAVYVSNSDLYFVGKFGLAVQELLHGDIVRLIGLHKNDSSTFLTLMRMSDFDEIIEYLTLKGYATQYISCPMPLAKTDEDPNAVMKGEDAPGGDLSNEQKRIYLEEAKEAILHQMSCDGFDTSDYKWDGWTCIDGVKKYGKEYPLVIRSNKSGRNTVLSASDWDQLMKENAMFVVNTNSGIGTVNFKQLLRSKENITIRFGSENIDEANRISKLAEAFAFFKGMQFDFESYIRPTISRWQSFMAPALETGEQACANTSIPLPE